MKRLTLVFFYLTFCLNTFSQLVTEETKDDAYIAPTKLITDKWWYGTEETLWANIPWKDGLDADYHFVTINIYFSSNGTCKIIYKIRADKRFYDNTTEWDETKCSFYIVSLTGKWTRQKGTLRWSANKMSAKCNYTLLEDVKKENLSIRKKDIVTERERAIVRAINKLDGSYFLNKSLSINRLDNEYMILGDYSPCVLVNHRDAYGIVKIVSKPINADILIDGKEEGSISQQSCGEHTYKLSAEGYNDVTGKFTIEKDCLKIISVHLIESPEEEQIIHDEVTKAAEFPGGERACYEYISKNLRYPSNAQSEGIQGRVICEFDIEKDGSISNVQISKGVCLSLDMEALRLIKSMPKWIPARKKNGETVKSHITLPLMFCLV